MCDKCIVVFLAVNENYNEFTNYDPINLYISPSLRETPDNDWIYIVIGVSCGIFVIIVIVAIIWYKKK